MTSSLKPAFYKSSSLRLLCHHCRRRYLPSITQKRLLSGRDPTKSDHLSRSLISDLDNLNEQSKPSSSADFIAAATKALGITTSQPKPGSQQSSSDPPVESEPPKELSPIPPPHHLHVYSTKHNCHITLTDGKRQPLISVSSGNIGFRKSARGSYEAAFQLGAYVMGRIQQEGLLHKIHAIELILRDFGPGREAFYKILLGLEGKLIRDRVVRVMDATRLKFGGTRSKKPRRLG